MTTLLMIGCGKMGGAILHGILDQKLPWKIQICDRNERNTQAFQGKVTVIKTLTEADAPDAIILGVKPQAMDALLDELTLQNFASSLFISIAAGKKISHFQEKLGVDAKIIRIMPNTPAAVGAGMTAAIANRALSSTDKDIAESIMTATGKFMWLHNEDQMDAVTPLSGSGPAYLFYLCEAMAAAGVNMGLSEDMAMTLARETLIGSAELLKRSDESAEQLRINVTSKGGTTEAALKVLQQDNNFMDLVKNALSAGHEKSKDL